MPLAHSQMHLPAAERRGRVHSVESMGAVDGPGLRFVIFLQGCLFRCKYCHNPDTWELKAGTERTVTSLIDEVRSYIPFMAESGGGVTVTGGEPMLQPDFVAGIFKECHALGIHTALDSNGYATEERARPVLAHTDLLLLDLKQLNPERHKALTGVENKTTLAFARLASDLAVPMWIRYVVVPGWSDDAADVESLAEFVGSLATVEKVELLPYHLLGVHKWEAMGMAYGLEGVEPPTKETMERIRGQLREHGLTVG